MHKSYQPDTERRKQAERVSMHTPPAYFAPMIHVSEPMPWAGIALGAAGLVAFVGVLAYALMGMGA